MYTDGLAHVYATSNPAYGCGWTDSSGKRHPTWPFFATREGLKRIYRIIKKHNPNGLLVNHASFSVVAPTISFSDIYYTGEHEDYENLKTARVRFSRRPMGIECKLLGASTHAWSPLHTAIALLHGTSIWGMGVTGRGDMCRKFMRIRKIYREFDIQTAKWIPYFKGDNVYFLPPNDKLKVSIYLHKGKGALLIAANLADAPEDGTLKLDLSKFGLFGKSVSAYDAMTQTPQSISETGEMRIGIPAKSFKLISLQSK